MIDIWIKFKFLNRLLSLLVLGNLEASANLAHFFIASEVDGARPSDHIRHKSQDHRGREDPRLGTPTSGPCYLYMQSRQCLRSRTQEWFDYMAGQSLWRWGKLSCKIYIKSSICPYKKHLYMIHFLVKTNINL